MGIQLGPLILGPEELFPYFVSNETTRMQLITEKNVHS